MTMDSQGPTNDGCDPASCDRAVIAHCRREPAGLGSAIRTKSNASHIVLKDCDLRKVAEGNIVSNGRRLKLINVTINGNLAR